MNVQATTDAAPLEHYSERAVSSSFAQRRRRARAHDGPRLAIVHDWLTGYRGGEKCLEVLCRRFPQASLYTLIHRRGSTSPAIERMRITTSFLDRIPAVHKHYRYCLPLMPAAVESLAIDDDVDLVVSFSHSVAKSVRVPHGVPHVSYCFTPMRYAWHQRRQYFETSAQRNAPRAARWLRAPLDAARDLVLDRLCRWDRATSDRVTHFVAASRTVAKRIDECYQRTSRVIYPPVDTDFYTPALVPREDYYLCVSALAPYKRIELAIAACHRLGRRLVVIGSGPERRALERLAGGETTLLGWASDAAIRDHLRRCRALLFPGVEDFGIVPVEAMACGAPVVAFAEGGATETLLPASENQPGTAVFFDEPSAESLANGIVRLEASHSLVSPTLARARALEFNTCRFERELVELIEQLALSPAAAPSRRMRAA